MRGVIRLLAFLVLLCCAACTGPAVTSAPSSIASNVPSASATSTAAATELATATATEVPTATAAATSAATPEATPVTTPAATPAATPPAATRNFDEALAFLTPETTLMSFDDWAQIKDSVGASDVTSQSPQEDRDRVLFDALVASPDRPVSDLEYVVGGYGVQSALVHAENWDFDVLDYEWDAVITHDGLPVYIVKLRDDLDMAPVIAHFDEREYATEEVNGATLRTHDLDLSADWLSGELAILNVGILEDGHTLVLSSSDETVRDYLSADRPTPPEPVLAAAAALEGPSAAHLIIGSEQICDFVDPILAGANEDIRDVVEEAGPLSPWDALAVGYSKKLDPIGRIAFGYADPAAADDDLKGRRLLAEEGPSLVRPEPISDVQFTVDDASASDGVLTLDVTPSEDHVRRLLQPVLERDLAYTTCGQPAE